MFAASTGVLMLATLITPAVNGAANYGAELTGAYEYAFSKGITTMSSIDNANMYGEITRGQLAKMISNWAEKELGTKVDATKVCSFTDTNTAEGDLAAYLTKSCQMGLMGQEIDAFRPNAKVTRGEFGTTLSRALWGNKYNGATPFYANHLQALKDAGIMTRIENPSQLEIRGYVMLMLQRSSAESLINKVVNTGANNTGTNNNSFSGVKAGDLSISLNSTNGVTSIPNDGVIKVAELNINATQDIQLQSLNVTRLGLSQNQGLKVWIEKDGRRITSTSSFFGDSKANLVFNGGYVVKKGEKLDLVISLDKDKVQAGSELSFKLSDLTSSAMNTTISPDTTGVYRTTNYSVTSLSFLSMTNADRSYNISKDTSFSFGEFKLQNDSPASMEKNVLIKNITFKVEGSDINNLKDFKLLKNGKELKTTYLVNGRDVTLTINDQLDSGKTAVYKVVATPTNIEDADGDKYTFVIRKAEDIIAEELGQNSVGYRVSIKELNNVDLKKTTIMGGTITLTRDANFPSVVSADWGYSDVTIAKGTIKLNQSTKFEKGLVLTAKAGSNLNAVRRASLVIDGRTYQATEITAGRIKFDSEIYLEKGSHNIELNVSLASSAVAGVQTFEIENIVNSSFDGGTYLNSAETPFKSSHMVGSLRVAKVNVQAQKIAFRKNGPAEDVKLVAGNTDEKVIFSGEITNTSNKNLEVTQFALEKNAGTVAGATATTKLADVFVHFADGSSSSTSVVNNAGVATIDSVALSLKPGESVKFELRTINSASLVANDDYRLSVKAKGTLEGNTVETVALNSVYVKVAGAATTSVVSNTNAKNKIVAPGVLTDVASFNYNVKNDSVDLDRITIATTNLTTDNLDDVSVSFDNITPSVESYSIDNTTHVLTVKFANLLTLPAKNYKVKVSANFSENTINATTAGQLQTEKTFGAVNLLNGIDNKGTGTMSFKLYVARAFPMVSLKEKTTSDRNEKLDLNVKKNTDDYKVELVKINGKYNNNGTEADAQFKKTSGAAEAFTNVVLSKDVDEVARAQRQPAVAVKSISFNVTDDEGKIAKYENVDASNIADFASLSL